MLNGNKKKNTYLAEYIVNLIVIVTSNYSVNATSSFINGYKEALAEIQQYEKQVSSPT